jgi:hypothetical protein
MKTDFGDPLSTTDYALCVYAGSASALVTEASAPGGGVCDGHPCWKNTAIGFKYREREAAPLGSLQILLKAGAAGKAAIGVVGKGAANPPLPPLPLAQPVTVQLVNGAGSCWQATYSAPARVNDATTFKDKSD